MSFKRILSLSLVVILSSIGTAVGQPYVEQAWAGRYSSPGALSIDLPKAVVADPWGNVIMTGRSSTTGNQSDFLTVKMDPKGNLKWFARYDRNGGDDGAEALTVDDMGNVYVTGYSEFDHPQNFKDYTTIKYDKNGNQQWVEVFEGLTPPESTSHDVATAIAVDNDGNVFVTGYSPGLDGGGFPQGQDYVTIKYNEDGVQQGGVARYNGPGFADDDARAIALDPAGNVYVTGSSKNAGLNIGFLTIKYDNNLNELWTRRYDDAFGGADQVQAMAVDAAGNVYVTGYGMGASFTDEYVTQKYDTNGNQLVGWDPPPTYDGPGIGSDEAHAIVVDSQGNVIVTGQSAGAGTSDDYATIKYDANGVQQWAKRFTSAGSRNDRAWSVVVDPVDDVYVAGVSFTDATKNDFAAVKYDKAGNEKWVERYDGPPSENDVVVGLGMDSGGNAYAAGSSWGTEDNADYTVVKLSQDRDGDGLLDDWEINGLDVDGDGSVDLDLPGPGWSADPDHKDLFIEVDTMVGLAPTQAALDQVVAAFAVVPNDLVNNPDALPGITVHLQSGGLDETNIPVAAWPNAWQSFDAAKLAYLGTTAERGDANWANIRRAKLIVYRYCVFARSYGGSASSGLAEIGGDDFIVTLGHPSTVNFLASNPIALAQPNDFVAGTFMHELGHCLGLRHGGADDIQYKPNYHSVMNYNWQVPDFRGVYHGSWGLDYSRLAFNVLEETDLNEAAGIGGHAGHQVPIRVRNGAGTLVIQRYANESGALDWNQDGDTADAHEVLDINGSGGCTSAGDATCEALEPFEDWSNLVFYGNGVNWLAGAVHGETSEDAGEFDFETHESIGQLLGDLNCDDVRNGADLQAFVLAMLDPAAYAVQYPGCDIMLADMDVNGAVDQADADLLARLLVAD